MWLGLLAEGEMRAGRDERADRLARKALAHAERVGLRDGFLYVRLLNVFGMICKYRGDFRNGARAYLRALRIARRSLRPNHPAVATLYHNLAGLEHARGRYVRAEPLARHSVDLRESALGPLHPDFARDIAALAGILDGLQRHDEAEAFHRRALSIFERRLGRDHREVAYTLANLAACLHSQRRTAEAEPLAARALLLQERILGPAHPEVESTRSNLAIIRGSRA